ncbi:MAG: hypothetical protein M3461_16185 [Pseudomonadota bacterium]|nr:hypothetical protein [Pseudomonadota bacterium]
MQRQITDGGIARRARPWGFAALPLVLFGVQPASPDEAAPGVPEGRTTVSDAQEASTGRLLAQASRRFPGALEGTAPTPAPAAPPAAPTGEEERPRPGAQPEPPGPQDAELPDPNRATGLERIPLPAPAAPSDFLPIPDRWRLAKDLGLVKEPWYDPYNRNILKSDRPFYRDWFFNVSVINDMTTELRRVPTPVAPQVSRGGDALDTFGDSDQFLFNNNLILALILFKGDTVFRPPDYELHITPVFNFNHTEVEELRVLNIDPREGETRDDAHPGIQELFLDVHLRNVSDRFDFDSVRFGIQPFSTDFRGFLFQDNQLGVRLFGTRDNNIWQYNLAWFRRLEKDTNSGLNDISDELREDDVVVGNLYRQDFPFLGYTSQGIYAYNRNREGDDGLLFDDNGFLARPATLGTERGRDYDVHYLGYNGDGHIGPVNLTTSFYYALGDQPRNAFNNQSTDIRAWFLAGEASLDIDWIRVRASALYATGDDDPFDDTDEGFDAIFENPIFAGYDTSYFIRQAIPLIGGGGVQLTGRNSVLPSLRSSKELGQSNFANPGVELYGLGADFDILPELRLSTNFNKLFFDETSVLEQLRNQRRVDSDIGWDLSAAIIYRPYFTQNIVLRLSGAILVPGQGFRDLFPEESFADEIPFSVLGNFVFTF